MGNALRIHEQRKRSFSRQHLLPPCGEMIIRRLGFTVAENHVVDGKCEYCGQPIPGVWK